MHRRSFAAVHCKDSPVNGHTRLKAKPVGIQQARAPASLQVRAVIQEPYGAEGSPGATATGGASNGRAGGGGGGGGGGDGGRRRPQRTSGFRWARRQRLPRSPAVPASPPAAIPAPAAWREPGAGPRGGEEAVHGSDLGRRLSQQQQQPQGCAPRGGGPAAARASGGKGQALGDEAEARGLAPQQQPKQQQQQQPSPRSGAARRSAPPPSGQAAPAAEGPKQSPPPRQQQHARRPPQETPAAAATASLASPSGPEPHGVARLSPRPCRADAVAGRAVSQLFYISTDFCDSKGLRVAVHTEDDIRSVGASSSSAAAGANPAAAAGTGSASGAKDAAAAGGGGGGGGGAVGGAPFDMFVDTTYSDAQLSLTFVSRRALAPGGVFLGLTSRDFLDRKGAQIPCYGWKSNGCTYNDHTGAGRLGGGSNGRRGAAAGLGAGSGLGGGGAGGGDAVPQHQGQAPQQAGPSSGGVAGVQAVAGAAEPLWRKGDSVELILRQGQGQGSNQLLLKVNGQAVDVINSLPSLRHWSWYVGLWAGGDVSCAVFQRDQYAVYWGDYAVKRYL